MTTYSRGSLSRVLLACAAALVCALVAATPAQAAVRPENANAMHRLYNPNTGEHFYTANAGERDAVVAAGWNYEGIGWYAPKEGGDVYRLYNPYAGDHHYTTNARERDVMVQVGWLYEGVGWLSDTAAYEIPVWREYNPNAMAGAHNFTTSKREHVTLCTLGWRGEGIAWYGVDPSGIPATSIASSLGGLTLEVGDGYDLRPAITVEPADTTDYLTWTTSDPRVVTVDDQGRVTAVGEGEAQVRVRTDSGKEAVVDIYVPRPGSVVGQTGEDPASRHTASAWARPAMLTSSKAAELFADGVTPAALYGPACLNVRASVDGHALPHDSDQLSNTLTEGDKSKLAAGTEGAYAVTVRVTATDALDVAFPSTITIVPDGTVIANDNDDDPRSSVATYASAPAEALPTNTEMGRDDILAAVGARAWDNGNELASLDAVSLDDGGLAQAAAAGEVGYYDVSVTYEVGGVRATKTVTVSLDGSGAIDYVVASSTASVPGGAVSTAHEDVTSRLTQEAGIGSSVSETTVGYTFAGWYEGQIASGTTPQGDPVSTEPTFAPQKGEGPWPASVTYTAYFRANDATPFTVECYLQDLTADRRGVADTHSLDPELTEERAGTTDTMTNVVADDIEGFTVVGVEQALIAGDGSAVVKVTYDRDFYTPELVANGRGTVPTDPTPAPFGGLLTKPADATDATGFAFTYWSEDAAGDEAWDFDSNTMPGDGVSLYATWEPIKSTITLVHNDDSGTTETIEAVYGTALDPVTVPAYAGYTFGGYWLNDLDTGASTQYVGRDGNWLFTWDGVEDITLAATWIARGDTPYTVRHWEQLLNDDGIDVIGYDHNEENYQIFEDGQETYYDVTSGQTAAQAHAYEGFKACAFTQQPIAGDGSTVIDIYYDRIVHQVIYEANGHGTAPAGTTAPYGASLVPAAPTEAAGFEFQGWLQDAEDPESIWDYEGDTMPNTNLTLWASWKSSAISAWETIGAMMYDGVESTEVGGVTVYFGDKPAYDDGAWRVSTPEQLAYVAYLINNGLLGIATPDIAISGDIDLMGDKYGATADAPLAWTPIAGFAGTLDGGGKTIDHLSVEVDGEAGLVYTLSGSATIRDIKLAHATVNSQTGNAGLLVGSTAGSPLTITGVEAAVPQVCGAEDAWAGGLVGVIDAPGFTVSSCVLLSPEVSAYGVGGVVGRTTAGATLTINDCLVVTPSVTGQRVAGGILGSAGATCDIALAGVQLGGSYIDNDGDVEAEYAVSTLGDLDGNASYTGGIVGEALAATSLSNCYATCMISGADGVAGLVDGPAETSVALDHSYFAARTEASSGTYALASGTTTYDTCYYDSTLLAGCAEEASGALPAGITAQPTAQLKRSVTAFYLNGRAFGSPWTQTGSKNAGYPSFGSLSDGSPYTATLDAGARATTLGTRTQKVDYGKTGADIELPTMNGYTFGGYYSDYGGEGTCYVDADGHWCHAWDFPENTTLRAYWVGNTISYVWPYNWTKQIAKQKLYDDGWAYYNQNEGKVLPTQADVGRTPGVTLVGWKVNGTGDVITELPATSEGPVSVTAYYVLGPASNWDQTYFPMRDRVEGYPPLPGYDAGNGGWQVTSGVELAYVMGANSRNAIARGRTANIHLMNDVDLTGNETFDSPTLGTQVAWGGTSSNPLLWIPTTKYSGELSGAFDKNLGDEGSPDMIVGQRRLTTLKIANSFSQRTKGARYGEAYYAAADATGFVKVLSGSGSIHDLVIVSPNVSSRNTCKSGKTTYSTTATLAGIADNRSRVYRVGIEGGRLNAGHVKSLHNERLAGLVGTLRGSGTIEDCYVRGANMGVSVTNWNWRYQSSVVAGITVASQSGATVRNCYFQGSARPTTRNVRQNRSGAVLPIKNFTGSAINGSGAKVQNCYVDTSSTFSGTRADGACVRKSSAELRRNMAAFWLNGNRFGTPWAQDDSVNGGWPSFGRLVDESPYTVTFNKQSGTGGTDTQDVYYGTRPDPVDSLPTRTGYVFGGYFAGTNGSGTQYVDVDGTWLVDWNELDPRTLYAKWTAIGSWQDVGQAMYNNSPVVPSSVTKPTYDEAAGAWLIETPEHLAYYEYINNASKFPAGTTRSFKLMADIDLTGAAWGGTSSAALRWMPLANSNGTFDGGGHTISKLRALGAERVGFVDLPSGTLAIKDITFASASVSATATAGVVVAHDNGKTLTMSNVHVLSSSSAQTAGYTNVGVGCLVGTNNGPNSTYVGCTVESCSVNSKSKRAGNDGNGAALVGFVNNNGSITFRDCHAKSTNVTGNGNTVGGFVAWIYRSATFERCSYEGGMVENRNDNWSGGFVGVNSQSGKTVNFTDCFATCRVNSTASPAGFIGNQKVVSNFRNCYFAGTFNRTGYAFGSTVGNSRFNNCYLDTSVCTNAGDKSKATQYNTATMKTRETAYKLSANSVNGNWMQDPTVNNGYPYYGKLSDYPTYTVTLDQAGATTAGTTSVEVTYGAVPAALTMPEREGYAFEGFWTGANGTGTRYVDAAGSWTGPWNELAVSKLYANWIKIDGWESIGAMVDAGVTSPAVGTAPTYDEATSAWQVATPEQLAYVVRLMNAGTLPAGTSGNIKLTADLDLAGTPYGGTADAPLAWTPVASLAGAIDGGGKTISNMSVSSASDAAFVATNGGEAAIRNLTFSGARVAMTGTDASAAGVAMARVAAAGGVTMENVTVNLSRVQSACVAQADCTGGLVGVALQSATVRNCAVVGTPVSGAGSVGGLVGSVQGSSAPVVVMDTCVVSASPVTGTLAGGAVGSVRSAVATVGRTGVIGGAVGAPTDVPEGVSCAVGGLVGHADGAVQGGSVGISDSFVRGTALTAHSQQPYVGGLVGTAPTADPAGIRCVTVASSYFAGTLVPGDAGGSWAMANPQALVAIGECYYDATLAGPVGDASVEGVTGLSSAAMRTAETAALLNAGRAEGPWRYDATINEGYPYM